MNGILQYLQSFTTIQTEKFNVQIVFFLDYDLFHFWNYRQGVTMNE